MKNLYKALSDFQSRCPLIKKDADNPFFRSKYAPLDSILPIIMPILQEVGLVITQIPNGLTLKTTLAHIESGEVLEGNAELILDKQNAQGYGSALTYARRYSIVAMLALNTDEYDDRNKASINPPVKQPTKPADNFEKGLDEDLKKEILKEFKRLEPTLDKLVIKEWAKENTGLDLIPENFSKILNKLKAMETTKVETIPA